MSDPFAVIRRQAIKGRYVFPCPACKGTGENCENCEGSGSCFMTKDDAEDYYSPEEIKAAIDRHSPFEETE